MIAIALHFDKTSLRSIPCVTELCRHV